VTQHGSGPAGWAKFDAILSAIEGLRAPLPLAAAAGIPACASGSAPAAGVARQSGCERLELTAVPRGP